MTPQGKPPPTPAHSKSPSLRVFIVKDLGRELGDVNRSHHREPQLGFASLLWPSMC